MKHVIPCNSDTDARALALELDTRDPEGGWEAWVILTERGEEWPAVTSGAYRSHNADDVRPL